MISAVLIDNGSKYLEKSLESLVDQTVRPKIVFVGGSRTNYEIVESILSEKDKIIRNVNGIWNARLIGILKSNEKYILSCDSDTIYHPEYVENAEKSLQKYYWIIAGKIKPLENKLSGKIEIIFFYNLFRLPYAHRLGFRKSSFQKLISISKNKITRKIIGDRFDVDFLVSLNIVPVKKINEMICYVSVPTYYFRKILNI